MTPKKVLDNLEREPHAAMMQWADEYEQEIFYLVPDGLGVLDY